MRLQAYRAEDATIYRLDRLVPGAPKTVAVLSIWREGDLSGVRYYRAVHWDDGQIVC
jgi:hypothetical protein